MNPTLATFVGTVTVTCATCGAKIALAAGGPRPASGVDPVAGGAHAIGRFAVEHMHGWSEKARTRTQVGDVHLTLSFEREERRL